MSRIALSIGHVRHSPLLFRWQATVISAFAGGSLTAAMLNLAGVVAIAFARSAQSRLTNVGSRSDHEA
jgi:hypothetical protein